MGIEVSLNDHATKFGTLRLKGLSGRRAVEGATLVFSCELELDPAKDEPRSVNNAAGHVSVKGLGDVGPCWLMDSLSCRSTETTEKTWFSVCVTANDGALRAIDGHRARQQNEIVSFELWLRVRGVGQKRPIDSQAILNVEVTTSDWFAALASAQYETRHIIDVPIQGGRVSQALALAAEHYRRAIEQWKKVSYPQVFTECRKVLESTRDVLKLSPRGIAEFDARQRTMWSNRECIEYARAAIHQIVHHSAHPGITDDPGPLESELLLGLTGSLLRFYADVTR